MSIIIDFEQKTKHFYRFSNKNRKSILALLLSVSRWESKQKLSIIRHVDLVTTTITTGEYLKGVSN